MSSRMRRGLIERVVGAYRPRAPDGPVRPAPEWRDLDVEGRREAFDASFIQRRLEAALDPDGLSSTARAVLDRLEPRSPLK